MTKANKLPTTVQMLAAIKRPKQPVFFNQLEIVLILGVALALSVLTIVSGLGAIGLIARAFVMHTFFVCVLASSLFLVAWAVSQAIAMVLALRAGFRPAATAVDNAIDREQVILADLERYSSDQLREHSKHLELNGKRLGRRASLVGVLTAIGVVVTNLHDAGGRAKIWTRWEDVSLFIWAGSLGLLIGAVALARFVSRIEQISGLFAIASDRADRREHATRARRTRRR